VKKAVVFLICLVLLCGAFPSCYQFTKDFTVEEERITYRAIHNDLEECFLESITVTPADSELSASPEGIRSLTVPLPTSLLCQHCGKSYRVSALGGFRGSGAPISPVISVRLGQTPHRDDFYLITLQVGSADLTRGSDWIIWEVLDPNGNPLPDESYTVRYALDDPHPTLRLGEDGQAHEKDRRFYLHVENGSELLTQAPIAQGYGYGEIASVTVKAMDGGAPTVLHNGIPLSPARAEENGTVYEIPILQVVNRLSVYPPTSPPAEGEWLLSEYARLHPAAESPRIRFYYGQFHACTAAMIDAGDYTSNLWSEQVEGYTFSYGDGNRILIYRYGEFFTLPVARALGYLSPEEVGALAASHQNAVPHLYEE